MVIITFQHLKIFNTFNIINNHTSHHSAYYLSTLFLIFTCDYMPIVYTLYQLGLQDKNLFDLIVIFTFVHNLKVTYSSKNI